MRSFVLAALCLTGALASPIEIYRRAYVTDLTVVTKTVYVTASPTPTAQPGRFYNAVDNNAAAVPAPAPKPAPAPAPAPAPSYVAKPPPPPPAPAPAPGLSKYQSLVLDQHNVHRRNHSAPDLVYDSALENSARILAQSCRYGHNTNINGGGYGQNIGYGVELAPLVTNLMYNAEMPKYAGLYGVASPTDFESWGHFSQIVWKKTAKVGCFTQLCGSLIDPNHAQPVPNVPYTVCNYSPPGNWAGEYADNVGRPLGLASLIV